MTVKIRQEINILNRELVNPTGDSAIAEIIDFDPADYNGETVYLEVVAKNTDGTNVLYVNLHDSGDTEHESLTVPINTTNYTLIRSQIDTTLTADEYHIYLEDNTATWASNGSIKSARLVILQSATDITETQTQIEIGAYELDLWSASSYATKPLTEPKYWKYESAKWDPTPTFTAAVTWACINDKYDVNIKLQEDNGSFGSWSDKVTIVTLGATQTVTYTESASFTPTNGGHYRIILETEGLKAGRGINIYNAKVIATQTDATAITKLQPEYLMINDAQSDTGLQEFLTDFDPDEWEGVSNDYYHEHSASGSGSNTKLQEDPGGTPADITNSSITGANLKRGFLIYRDTDYQGGNYRGVWGDGTYIYVACNTGGLRSYSVDGSGNLTYIDTDYQGGDYYDVWGDGTYIYVACNTGGLRSYSVDGSGNLTYIDTDYQDGNYIGVWGDGTYIYVACYTSGLRSYSVDGSGNLTYIDTDYQGGDYYDVWGDGTYIYVGCDTGGLRSYSVDGSGNLTYIDTDDQGGSYRGVWGDGTYIYVACYTSGLRSYSVDGSGILTYIDIDYQGENYHDVWGDGTYIYVGCYTSGLRSYSVDGSGNLTYIDTDDQGGSYNGVWGDGTYIYVACDTDGLRSYSVDGIIMPATAKEIDSYIVTA